MSGLQSLLTLWLVYMGVALSPGVNFALIGTTATRHTRREALLVAAGVVTASAVWMSAALLGLVALAERAGAVFGVIRIAAGLYLILLGIQKIRQRNETPAAALVAEEPNACGVTTELVSPPAWGTPRPSSSLELSSQRRCPPTQPWDFACRALLSS